MFLNVFLVSTKTLKGHLPPDQRLLDIRQDFFSDLTREP